MYVLCMIVRCLRIFFCLCCPALALLSSSSRSIFPLLTAGSSVTPFPIPFLAHPFFTLATATTLPIFLLFSPCDPFFVDMALNSHAHIPQAVSAPSRKHQPLDHRLI